MLIYTWILDSIASNMAYTRLQNYTNMMVGKHGIQIFEVMVCYVIAFIVVVWCFISKNTHPLLYLGKSSIQSNII